MKTRFAPFVLAAFLTSAVSHAAVTYDGNGSTGFGGTVGNGSLELDYGASAVGAVFTRGTDTFTNALVIYVDSQAGGIGSTANLTDAADGLRQAISGFNGTDRSTLTFDGDFAPDYAIAFDQGFAGLWQLVENGSHGFIAGLGLTPTGTDSASSYSLSFNLADVGITPGSNEPFDFVTTYISTTAFRSDESIGNDVDGLQGYNSFTSGAAQTVPEPTVAFFGTLGLLGILRRRR